MGNCVSYNCSCACIDKVCSHTATSAHAAESCCKKQPVNMVMVVHSVEQRVLEMGGGAPITVAELMLEFPGHFVVKCETGILSNLDSSESAPLLKRATPLPADQDALPGHSYILFPMHRIHTRVAAHEYVHYMGLLRSYVNAQLLPIVKKKTSLHSLLLQASSSKVTPLSSLELDEVPPHLTAHGAPDADIEDEIIDSLLQHFCSSQIAPLHSINGNGFGESGGLVRSKSWIPKLETINESSVLVV